MILKSTAPFFAVAVNSAKPKELAGFIYGLPTAHEEVSKKSMMDAKTAATGTHLIICSHHFRDERADFARGLKLYLEMISKITSPKIEKVSILIRDNSQMDDAIDLGFHTKKYMGEEFEVEGQAQQTWFQKTL